MEPVNLGDLESLARRSISRGAFDYISGGAGDEVTLGENLRAFRRFRLRPRVLVDVSAVDISTTLLGRKIESPVLLAPTAFQTLTHPEGELATARAAAGTGTVMVVSSYASRTLEEIAEAADGPRWFQLYCHRDREVTRSLVERAAASGYGAICLTVDAPRLGRRERDIRNRVQLPEHALPANFVDRVDLSSVPVEERGSAIARYAADLLDPSLTWEDVDWLRTVTDLPLLVKGILTSEDAQLAVQHGVDGVIVSNHGGRQLDGVPATIEVLGEVAEAVEARAEILLDGGVRRGTDVIKALSLGARAVLIGRPYLWGLAVDGEGGVRRVIEMLRAELELGLALIGCPTVSHVTRNHVTRFRG